jgi:hypothetical protein
LKILKKTPQRAQQFSTAFAITSLLAAPAFAAAPANMAALPGGKNVHAAEVDCDKMKAKLLDGLTRLRTKPEEIQDDKHCRWSFKPGVAGKDACEATYKTINEYADKLEKKADETCQLVQEAKDIKGDGTDCQATCLRALSKKDRAVSANLADIASTLKKAKSEFLARQKADWEVAQKYQAAIKYIQDKVASAKTPEEVRNILSCEGIPNSPFGLVNGYSLLNEQGWLSGDVNSLRASLNNYNTEWPKAFPVPPAEDPDSSTITDKSAAAPLAVPSSSPPRDVQAALAGSNLGHYTDEMVFASNTAADGFKYAKLTVPTVQDKAQQIHERAIALDAAAARMDSNYGSIPGDAPANSGLTGIKNPKETAANDLTNAAGASRAISGLSLSRGSSGGGGGGGADAGSGPNRALASVGGIGNASESATLSNTGSGSPGVSASSAALVADPATTSSAKKSSSPDAAANEAIGSNFGPLGAVSFGSEESIGSAPASKSARAGGARSGSSASFGSYVGGSAKKETDGQTAAGADAESPANFAGGLSASPRGLGGSALDPMPPAGGEGGMSLREMLRRRLSERLKNGGDADASSAADTALEMARGGMPGSTPLRADGTSMAPGAETEQAGPQAMDSDPLFQRVHKAHNRFQLRAFPRNAGI